MAIRITLTRDKRDYRIFVVNLQGIRLIVTVTAKAFVVQRWIASMYHFNLSYVNRLIVGLGVQWTPGHRGASADTLQLCVGRRCLVYQLSHSPSVPISLRELLGCRLNTFVGFWNSSDRSKLENSAHRLYMVRDPLDMRQHVQTRNGVSLAGASVEEIVQECLGIAGVRMRPEISMSNWNRVYLSHEQVLQVAIDAYCAFKIGIKTFR